MDMRFVGAEGQIRARTSEAVKKSGRGRAIIQTVEDGLRIRGRDKEGRCWDFERDQDTRRTAAQCGH